MIIHTGDCNIDLYKTDVEDGAMEGIEIVPFFCIADSEGIGGL